ncbi:hypothetical protein WR25_04941 [Diploscapter pachys]|uniref:RNA polymerase II assembly factor Rtp1 C-terminal domain-containing protein n=1 Tax=Diploscapter pachys TaxID=2018661 RepID=A0A2A2JQT1_9BILA|nr:hypothetical protein WR25_04941 [Diploscapter pachys]
MSEKDRLIECLECLKILTTKDTDLDLKKFKWDIFAALHSKLVEKVESTNFFSEILQEEPEASSSNSSSQPSESVAHVDGRLLLGDVLQKIFDEISSSLRLLNRTTDDEFKLLSLDDVQTISAAFQFFILTSLLPFFEDGVGLPPHRRSNFIKQWKRLTSDQEFQKEKLKSASSCLERLLNSNEALKIELIRKYLDDVICAMEQASIGNRLSSILTSENGLQHMLNAYQELAGPTFWDNTPMLESIARHFAVPPKTMKKSTYYENLVSQFFAILMKEESGQMGSKISMIFAAFCDELRKRDKLAFGVLVLDRIFHPWERFLESTITSVVVTKQMIEGITLLAMWGSSKTARNFIFEEKRMTGLLPIFLDLLTSSCLNSEASSQMSKDLSNKLQSTVKFVLGQSENKKSSSIWQYEESKQKMITVLNSELDSDDEDAGDVDRLTLQNLDDESILYRRVQMICGFIKANFDASKLVPLLFELSIKSVKQWSEVEQQTQVQNIEDQPRFVSNEIANLVDSEWTQLASHLMADSFFELISESDVDPTDENVLLSMITLAQTVLKSTRTLIEARMQKEEDLDVVSKQNEESNRVLQLSIKSSKMVTALVGAIVLVATNSERAKTHLADLSAEMGKFSKIANLPVKIDDSLRNELREIAADVTQLAELLQGVGIEKTEVEQEGKKATYSKPSSRPLVETLLEELNDEMEPIRGQALLTVAKLVRKRNPEVLKCLDEWLYGKVKELVADPDSYVFLMAINALGEIALHDTKYLEDLIEFFVTYKGPEEPEHADQPKDDSAVIVRGKVAETIGKVFRFSGDFAPLWFNRFFGICIDSLRDLHDVMRASVLSTLSDLTLACRGRGIEKYLTEIFTTVDSLLKYEQSELVRRSAVHLLRQCIRSAASDNLFEVLGANLRDLRRTLTWLWKWDKDHIVRLHAQLAIEEIAEGMKILTTSPDSDHIRKIQL